MEKQPVILVIDDNCDEQAQFMLLDSVAHALELSAHSLKVDVVVVNPSGQENTDVINRAMETIEREQPLAILCDLSWPNPDKELNPGLRVAPIIKSKTSIPVLAWTGPNIEGLTERLAARDIALYKKGREGRKALATTLAEIVKPTLS